MAGSPPIDRVEGRRGVGRPTRLTPRVQQAIVDAVAAGNFLEVAFRFGGISRKTGFEWLKRGADDDALGQESIWTEFRDAVLAAESRAEIMALGFVRQAMVGDWKAAAWYLERKHRERWGRTVMESEETGSPEGYAAAVAQFLLETQFVVPPAPIIENEQGAAPTSPQENA